MNQDSNLIKRMKQGDEDAMDAFVRKYYPPVLRYCRYHVSDRETAQDLAQETFENFFRGLAHYRFQGKDQNYLYVIAGNLCRDFYRKRIPIPMEHPGETKNGRVNGQSNKTLIEDCQTSEEKDNAFTETEKRLDMEQALACLTPEHREVIFLYYFQELKLREVSQVLGISLPLTKYRMHRAKQQLKEILKRGEEV